MAKNKGPSKHSRAARRATSPSIDTDKSLKDIPLPKRNSESTFRPSVLAVHRSAGVSKKSKPVRKSRMTSKMRRRHEKGLEMAEAITERTGLKIEKSIGRAKNVQRRSRNWEDINKDAATGEEEEQQTGGSRFGGLMEEDGEDDWEDEGDGFDPANPAASKAVAVEEEEDEIL
ncbi:ribosome biogenesis protein Alb1 [Pochonia chlamydosporia 170]|uniref:Ribosome biogenesis protein Alb1 n=1 Tax=Pochonia chlamydosporia 170 TaxID=1380566 RepID=A0A179FJD3_METCM|nr:ribosome biogenesis protein Alb1 [Pochonia chlamydosporia 170]OAQ65360.1 ribosome biogenesis protein Alb1 [Pochonia chlamydosporia 170]